MKHPKALIAAILVVLSACAGTARMNEQEARERYMDYAGAPIRSMSYLGRFNGWRPLGRDKLVVWTGVNQAYLLTVEPTCFGLDFAERIVLDSPTGGSIHSGLDSVRFHAAGGRRERCRITEIRPVDYKQMRADMRAGGGG